MDARDHYRDKFREASTAVPCTCFNNELIYFGKLKFSQVVNRENGIVSSSLVSAFERFRLGRCTDTFAALYFDDRNIAYLILNTIRTRFKGRHVAGVLREDKAYYGKCRSGSSQILLSRHVGRGSVGLQLATDNFQRRIVSVSYGCATVHDFVCSMRRGSGNKIVVVSSSGYGEHAAALSYDCSTREIGGNADGWYIRPNVLLQKKGTFECKRSGIIGGVQEYHTLCEKWPWTSADLVPVSKEAMVNDCPMFVQVIAKVSTSFENSGKCNDSDFIRSTLVAIVTGLGYPWPSSRFEEIVLHCDVDQVLTFHEAKTFRKSYFKGNTNPWPTTVGNMKKMVNVLSDNRSKVETSKPVLELLLHGDVDQVLTVHEAKTTRRSYFKEQTNRLNPNYVRMNQNGFGVLQNRMTDVIQQCFFNETLLLLLVKNRVLLRGGSLTFCARCLNPHAKTCKSHIISRCALEQIFGKNKCMYISQREELVSSNGCWFRLQCRICDNSTCADENKFKKRFCAKELKVSPQKIPAVELRVIIAFIFRGIMANVDLLRLIARNQEWQGILNCVLRLREQCIKPRSAIKVISCKLMNDSTLRNQSVEFPILVSSEIWGSFFYLWLQQYCYAIPIEQQRQDSLQANFPAVVKAISGKLRQKRKKYLGNFSEPINQALMVTGYVTGGHLFI